MASTITESGGQLMRLVLAADNLIKHCPSCNAGSGKRVEMSWDPVKQIWFYKSIPCPTCTPFREALGLPVWHPDDQSPT